MTRVALSLLCLYCLTGCSGRVLDLDHPAPAASAPTVGADPVVVLEEQFSGVWVDDQRVYWLTGFGSFQSCLKTDCDHTRLTYSDNNHQQITATVTVGYVYWTSGKTIFSSCTGLSCGAKPVLVTQDPALGNAIFADRDYLYWSSDFDIYRCQASGCARTPEVVARDAGADFLVFDESHTYWLGASGIMSAPSDGSQPPKLLVEQSQGAPGIQSLAAGDGELYWATDKQVFRCSIRSCNTDAATLVATADARITDLKLDGSALYWLEADSIHSCPLVGCEQSTTVTPPKVAQLGFWGEPSRFAIDANNLYWLEARENSDIGVRPPGLSGKSIRRTAK